MKQIRILILFGTLAVFVYFVNSGIMSAENSIKTEQRAYFELATYDPQSLTQGFYMTLNYQIEWEARNALSEDVREGQLVVSLDEDKIAHFERVYVEGETLAQNEMLVNYYAQDLWRVRIGVDSFLFQQGHADDYANARYAEVRILPDGVVILVQLADENLETIIPD